VSQRGADDGATGGVLLIEGSAIGRQLLGLLLRPRFDRLVPANDCAQATALLAERGPFDVVLVDLDGHGDAEAFVIALRSLSAPPAVLVMTRTPSLELETRYSLLGVVAFLAKPVGAPALFGALRGLDRGAFVPTVLRKVARYADVWAEALDGETGAAAVRFEVHDITRDGAFLLTHASLPLGERLMLCIRAGREAIEVAAEVAPAAAGADAALPGVSVRFVDVGGAAARALERLRDA